MTSKRTKTTSLLVFMLSLLLLMLLLNQTALAENTIADIPSGLAGRILTPEQTGDTVDWLEIAVNGSYSLIIRTDFINWNSAAGRYGDVSYQSTAYGNNYQYAGSTLQKKINDWFDPSIKTLDSLPANAKLRDFTVKNNALSMLGSCNTAAAAASGYSKPSEEKARLGDNIAFALSWGEAYNFVSLYGYRRDLTNAAVSSPPYAQTNFGQLKQYANTVYGAIWLRSPGDVSGTAGSLEIHGAQPNQGRVYQSANSCLIYPALWVESSIFPLPLPAPAANPTPVDGRILPKDKAGDSSAWVELAQYEGYALIMRQEPITGGLTAYSSSLNDASYGSSLARTGINNWYNNTLSSTARLRDFAVTHDALRVLGTIGYSYVDGLSLPYGGAARTGNDVAFALSYCEAVLYCSTQYANSMTSGGVSTSSYIARNNMAKLLPKYVGANVAPAYWLRTPGASYYAAGCVAYTGGDSAASYGRAYQHTITGTYAHYRPALWVDAGIFGDTTYTLSYNANGGSGAPPPQTVAANTNATISSTIPVYDIRTFAGWATGADATIPQYQPGDSILMSGNITLYAVWNKIPDAGESGRILIPEKSGDTVNWIEIAQDGIYSLIVRTNYININTLANTAGNPAWQYTSYGATSAYTGSNVRTKLNDWFNGTAAGYADNLPATARMRRFTMQNNALSMLGSCCNLNASLTDGLSKPGLNQVATGNDISFALSYSEAANYCSEWYFVRGNVANQMSSPNAVANYRQISIPDGYIYGMWLRSPGDVANTAGELGNETNFGGRVFQFALSPSPNSNYGLVYPALWVDSAIFDDDLPPVHTVTGLVWPLANDRWGSGATFLSAHDIKVELRPTFLTPALPALSVTAVAEGHDDIGRFTIENVPAGNYVLCIMRPGYLTRAMLVNITDTDLTLLELAPPGLEDKGIFNLWWGDSSGDGRVDNEDILMIMELMYLGVSAQHPLYNPACDLNADGLIDNEDLLMVLESWDKSIMDYAGITGVNPFQ